MTASEVNEEAEKPQARALWRNTDFSRYLMGYTASEFASQVSVVAIPLVAVLALKASSLEVGVMRAAEQIPYLLFVLFVGVLVDRWRRRNVLVVADLGRAAVLVLVPITYAVHGLSMVTLYIVAFLVGACTVLFDVSAQAYLPRLVSRDLITPGNSMIESMRSASLIAGPALGGVFVAWFSPPNAILACVVFYLISAATIVLIRKPEPVPEVAGDTPSPFRQIGEGFGLVFRNPILRSTVLIVAMFNFSYAAYLAIYVVFLPVELKLSSYAIGIAFAATGPGLLVGALFSSWLPRRIGYGPVLTISAVVSCLLLLGVSLLHGNGIITVAVLFLLNFAYAALSQTFIVALVSIRQSITPDRLLGRVMATHRFLGVGPVPLGSLLGGILGEQLGLRSALFTVTVLMTVVSSLFFFSALRTIGRQLPEPAEA